jgi:hypothetical protein
MLYDCNNMKSTKGVSSKTTKANKIISETSRSRNANKHHKNPNPRDSDSRDHKKSPVSKQDSNKSVEVIEGSRLIPEDYNPVSRNPHHKPEFKETKIKLPFDPADSKDLAQIAQDMGLDKTTHQVVRYSQRRKNSQTKEYHHKIVPKPQLQSSSNPLNQEKLPTVKKSHTEKQRAISSASTESIRGTTGLKDKPTPPTEKQADPRVVRRQFSAGRWTDRFSKNLQISQD